MSETKETTDKTLSVGRKPLSLKRTVESGHVRQSFSHGRSKSVVVEKKKKRTISSPGEGEPGAPLDTADIGAQGPGGLSTGEMDARARALQQAREIAEQEARETAAEREAQRLKEEAERAAAPPPSEPVPAVATTAVAPTPPPSPVAPKKVEPVRGPIVVLPSADKPKTDVRRTETVAKRKIDAEPADDDDARSKKKGAKVARAPVVTIMGHGDHGKRDMKSDV
jgi:translation initiation factor IF-2